MLDYLKAELLRFRGWAIAYFVLHLAVLGFFCRVMDLAQQPKVIYQGFGAAYLASGLLLGAFQMAGYRRPNTWLNLLHRPVGHQRIGGALTVASGLLLLGAVLLPVLLCAIWQDRMTARVVDARHYQLALASWLLAMCGYFSGAFALLANRRYAFAPFAVLCGIGYSAATGTGALAFQAAAMAGLAAMVLVSFKPDLEAPPRGIRAIVIALPLQLSIWLLMMVLGLAFEIGWLLQGSHPNNLEIPLPGSAKEADRADARGLMIAGLRRADGPDAALWREQAAISDLHTLEADLGELPVRGQLTNPAPLQFDDPARRVRWTFAHDDMRFHGYSLVNQRSRGALGVSADRAFGQPPLPVRGRLLASGRGIYQYDDDTARILLRIPVPAGEHVAGLGEVADRIGVLTDRALYLYDRRDLQDSARPLVHRMRITAPGRVGNLARIDAMELIDGMLLSFTYTRGPFDGRGTAFQQVLRIDEQGRSHEVARRSLSSGYPLLYATSRWYTSPALHWAATRAMQAFSGYRVEFDRTPPPVPNAIRILAVGLCIASMLAAAWRTGRTGMSPTGRLAWLAMCAVVGMPALFALWLLHAPRERAARRDPALVEPALPEPA